uniref:Uncharacterized protein n=1 Tax=Brassica oleracea TaxID=3712 RepID=A0A3P6D3N7_BRAOL|nr:unnamed protein product [Brassica oleracea]
MSDGYYYSSKKTDDVCEDVCGQNGSRAAKALSRVRCLLRGLDFKTYILFFTLVPLLIFGAYLHGQKLTYFLRPLWQSPPQALPNAPSLPPRQRLHANALRPPRLDPPRHSSTSLRRGPVQQRGRHAHHPLERATPLRDPVLNPRIQLHLHRFA